MGLRSGSHSPEPEPRGNLINTPSPLQRSGPELWAQQPQPHICRCLARLRSPFTVHPTHLGSITASSACFKKPSPGLPKHRHARHRHRFDILAGRAGGLSSSGLDAFCCFEAFGIPLNWVICLKDRCHLYFQVLHKKSHRFSVSLTSASMCRALEMLAF